MIHEASRRVFCDVSFSSANSICAIWPRSAEFETAGYSSGRLCIKLATICRRNSMATVNLDRRKRMTKNFVETRRPRAPGQGKEFRQRRHLLVDDLVSLPDRAVRAVIHVSLRTNEQAVM
ncbi:unnamed protein product [Soboliphyme baturini]|uniref:Transposase n=1 Tax=Soboliphyme baturini TaxID=241478 RepID=A0A183IBU4_9BILA|nr:unnamed protein product [Soboliphyme baturini]